LADFNGNFFDENYFKKGKETGKSAYTGYHWMPQRSFREALAIIDYLHLNENSYILDVGCAFGFLVKALRELEIKADGCDISEYALSFTPEGCWDCSSDKSWDDHSCFGYTHIIMKDVLEHMTKHQLIKSLENFTKIAPIIICIIPIGDDGKYRIADYHNDVSHLIIENEEWWINIFEHNGWHVIDYVDHVQGLKDNWYSVCKNGNCVFVLERK
jgi:SAM-dependent methyltransferase